MIYSKAKKPPPFKDGGGFGLSLSPIYSRLKYLDSRPLTLLTSSPIMLPRYGLCFSKIAFHRACCELKLRTPFLAERGGVLLLEVNSTISKTLAQTWLISLMFCSKHIAHYRPSSLIRAFSARAGWHARAEFYSSRSLSLKETIACYGHTAPGRA